MTIALLFVIVWLSSTMRSPEAFSYDVVNVKKWASDPGNHDKWIGGKFKLTIVIRCNQLNRRRSVDGNELADSNVKCRSEQLLGNYLSRSTECKSKDGVSFVRDGEVVDDFGGFWWGPVSLKIENFQFWVERRTNVQFLKFYSHWAGYSLRWCEWVHCTSQGECVVLLE